MDSFQVRVPTPMATQHPQNIFENQQSHGVYQQKNSQVGQSDISMVKYNIQNSQAPIIS